MRQGRSAESLARWRRKASRAGLHHVISCPGGWAYKPGEPGHGSPVWRSSGCSMSCRGTGIHLTWRAARWCVRAASAALTHR